MRTITNNSNLPKPLYNALAADEYKGGGDISVTRLIAPPRIVTLRKFHENEIEEDATDRVWMLLGNSVHHVMELASKHDKEMTVETRLSMYLKGIFVNEEPLVWLVTGQPDVYHQGNIYDWKVTSIWSVLHGKVEWEQQLNLQAMLHRNNGDEVKSLSIVAIMRDWQVNKARREKDYPPHAAKVITFPMWTQEKCIEFATARLKLHQRSQLEYEKHKDPEKLVMCSDEERFYSGHKYAVFKVSKKTGIMNKRADRVFMHKEEAMTYMQNNIFDMVEGKQYAPVQERPGQNHRCLYYCSVWNFCPLGRSLRKIEEIEEESTTE